MTPPEQVGAPVLCFGRMPVYPGDRVRAVLVPLVAPTLNAWSAVRLGDELVLHEGLRECGRASVEWIRSTEVPLPEADADRFCSWASGEVDSP